MGGPGNQLGRVLVVAKTLFALGTSPGRLPDGSAHPGRRGA